VYEHSVDSGQVKANINEKCAEIENKKTSESLTFLWLSSADVTPS
jgi:hypothetical protein